jgi:hypothetical protein
MKDRIQLLINDGIADVRLARPTKLNALDRCSRLSPKRVPN